MDAFAFCMPSKNSYTPLYHCACPPPCVPLRRCIQPPYRRVCPVADVHAFPTPMRALLVLVHASIVGVHTLCLPTCAPPTLHFAPSFLVEDKVYKGEGSLISPLYHPWLCVMGLLCGLLT